jgi:hypothetical protein
MAHSPPIESHTASKSIGKYLNEEKNKCANVQEKLH